VWQVIDNNMGWLIAVLAVAVLSLGCGVWSQMQRYSRKLNRFDEWAKRQDKHRLADLKDLTEHRTIIARAVKDEHAEMITRLREEMTAVIKKLEGEMHALRKGSERDT